MNEEPPDFDGLPANTHRFLQWLVLSKLQKQARIEEYKAIKARFYSWFGRMNNKRIKQYGQYLLDNICRDKGGVCYFRFSSRDLQQQDLRGHQRPLLRLVAHNPDIKPVHLASDAIKGFTI